MVTESDWRTETERLRRVLAVVQSQLTDAQRMVGLHVRRTREEWRTLWEEGAHQVTSPEEWIELAQAAEHQGQGERNIAFYKRLARRLEKMLESPYFGRVDFRADGAEQADRVYIGISGLQDSTTGELLVFDWRAPISSLFYDAEPGPAAYRCQDRVVLGTMELKRQYKIARGQLEFMFDTDLKIDDEMLQELLGRNIDEKMRTIVTSIQREQNRVIRDDDHDLLVVQGPAGSGKTAIALHRAAYLLYRHRDDMDARSIVIFSPNRVFSDYISAVLPELGEENVVQTTFHDYAQLGSGVQGEDVYAQLEYLFGAVKDADYQHRVNAIRLKGAPVFHQALRRYVTYLEEGGSTSFMEVAHNGRVVMTKEEMADLFLNRHRHLPLTRRLEKIRQRALFLLAPLEEERRREWREILAKDPDHRLEREIKWESNRRTQEEFSPVKSELVAWASFDVLSAYRRLFTDRRLMQQMMGGEPLPADWDDICRLTLAGLDGNHILYEDVTPLLYLKRMLEGGPVVTGVRHVLIDEAQDYTPLQFELFGLVFPHSSFTVLGDLHQSVHPYLHVEEYDSAMTALNRRRAALMKLTKSYRSTEELMAFARALLTDDDQFDVVRRGGTLPRLVRVAPEQAAAAIAHDLQALQEKGLPSVAVLCKTQAECEQLQRSLRAHKVDVRLLTARDEHFRQGAVILPVYLAKGLEFDACVIHDVSASAYGAENERGLLYTACTRALHELHLYYSGTLSPFIAAVDSSLYVAEDNVS